MPQATLKKAVHGRCFELRIDLQKGNELGIDLQRGDAVLLF